MDYKVHGILQAGILEWVDFPFSSGSSLPRNLTRISCTACGFFTNWAIMEYEYLLQGYKPKSHWSWPILAQITKFLVPNHQELCIITDSICVQACGSTGTPNLLTSQCGQCLNYFHVSKSETWASWWLRDKESTCNAGNTGERDLIPGLGGSPGEGHDNLFQYSCLKNPMDRRTWQVTVHRATKSQHMTEATQHEQKWDQTLETLMKIKRKTGNR